MSFVVVSKLKHLNSSPEIEAYKLYIIKCQCKHFNKTVYKQIQH